MRVLINLLSSFDRSKQMVTQCKFIHDICNIGNNRVAIATGRPEQIQLFDVDQDRPDKTQWILKVSILYMFDQLQTSFYKLDKDWGSWLVK